MPAWERICDRVKAIISWAMSVSRIRLSLAERFSAVTFRLLIVCSNRFCRAPRLARAVDTLPMAVSRAVMAEVAPDWLDRSMVSTPRPAALKPPVVPSAEAPSVAPAPSVTAMSVVTPDCFEVMTSSPLSPCSARKLAAKPASALRVVTALSVPVAAERSTSTETPPWVMFQSAVVKSAPLTAAPEVVWTSPPLAPAPDEMLTVMVSLAA